MNFKSYLAAIALLVCGSVSAQNATKADLAKLENQVNALSQKVAQLETNLERVIAENVNLVEQLNIKTVTSTTDKNGIQWDIVKVEPNADNNEVIVSLRITNNTGVNKKFFMYGTDAFALDSNTNLSNNKYSIEPIGEIKLEHGIPLNTSFKITKVPVTSSYLSLVQLTYNLTPVYIKFNGVHIPW